VDTSNKKAQNFIQAHRVGKGEGGTAASLLNILEVDLASMKKVFGRYWSGLLKNTTSRLGNGFSCREFYNTLFITISKDGLASTHAPNTGIIVLEGSKEAKDLTAKINTYIHEIERRKAAQTPSKGRMGPIARPTPSPSDSGNRKRKCDDFDDDSDDDSDDESDAQPDDLLTDESEDEADDEIEIDPKVAEKIADNVLMLIKAQLDDQSTGMPSIRMQNLAQSVLARCMSTSLSDQTFQVKYLDRKNRTRTYT